MNVSERASLFNMHLTFKVILMEGRIVSLTNKWTFSNVRSSLNQCRREGTGTVKGQAGGNLCRGGQRQDSLIGITRERTGRGKAGGERWMDITKNGEEMLVSTTGYFSPELQRVAELQLELSPLILWDMATWPRKQISLPLEFNSQERRTWFHSSEK